MAPFNWDVFVQPQHLASFCCSAAVLRVQRAHILFSRISRCWCLSPACGAHMCVPLTGRVKMTIEARRIRPSSVRPVLHPIRPSNHPSIHPSYTLHLCCAPGRCGYAECWVGGSCCCLSKHWHGIRCGAGQVKWYVSARYTYSHICILGHM